MAVHRSVLKSEHGLASNDGGTGHCVSGSYCVSSSRNSCGPRSARRFAGKSFCGPRLDGLIRATHDQHDHNRTNSNHDQNWNDRNHDRAGNDGSAGTNSGGEDESSYDGRTSDIGGAGDHGGDSVLPTQQVSLSPPKVDQLLPSTLPCNLQRRPRQHRHPRLTGHVDGTSN